MHIGMYLYVKSYPLLIHRKLEGLDDSLYILGVYGDLDV